MVPRAVLDFSTRIVTSSPSSSFCGTALRPSLVRPLRPSNVKGQRLGFTPRRGSYRHALRGARPVRVAAQAAGGCII